MTDYDVRSTVLAYLSGHGPLPGETPEAQLAFEYLDEGLIDSLGIFTMVMTFEETFGIRFSPQHLQSEEFRTVGGLITLVGRLRAEQADG